MKKFSLLNPSDGCVFRWNFVAGGHSRRILGADCVVGIDKDPTQLCRDLSNKPLSINGSFGNLFSILIRD